MSKKNEKEETDALNEAALKIAKEARDDAIAHFKAAISDVLNITSATKTSVHQRKLALRRPVWPVIVAILMLGCLAGAGLVNVFTSTSSSSPMTWPQVAVIVVPQIIVGTICVAILFSQRDDEF